ncbi:MAG: priA [Parachlamydiales bacterium]|nr:priA [Parachlamydiales bacterium]
MSEDRLFVGPASSIAEVLLDQNLEKPLDYSIPPDFLPLIRPGFRVEVPVRGHLLQGTVFLIKNATDRAVKPLSRLLPEESSLPEPLWNLALWMARYYCCPLQRTLKCLTPPSIRKEIRPRIVQQVCLILSRPDAAALCSQLRIRQSAQAAVLEAILASPRPPTIGQLVHGLELSRSAIATLVKKKAIRLEAVSEEDLMEADFFSTQPKTLNPEQLSCLQKIDASLTSGQFAAHLIHGITGSGKTEIYLQAIQRTLDLGKSALMLVPEIALTSQTIERFRARFGLKLALLHHRRSLGQRTEAWESLRSGGVKIAIGARSAIFSPAKNVGLIIIDEEHDSSYKQSEEMPAYHARDVAVMRAKMEKAVVILGSATPALESYYNAQIGKYILSTIKVRATAASLPTVRIVDMKIAMDRTGGFTHFCQELLDGIKMRCETGEQTLLLLNRRGFHRMQLCAECRHIVKCPHCDLSLTFHREANELRCHLCNYLTSPLKECPTCRSRSSLEFRGFGTEHVERSLHAIFPEVRTLRMDRDTTRGKDSHEELFKQFRAHKADVLIGTQMIAKGFHFPSVTLVGVLNADAALQIPDYRSSESVFQLLTQVAGRSGRAELAGEVILQTFMPEHPMLKLAASQDFSAFYERELDERRLFGFPPFCRLIKIVFSGPDERQTSETAARFRQMLLEMAPQDAKFMPPLPSGHPKVKDLYRFQFLIKTNQVPLLSELIAALRLEFSRSRKISILVDVDPISTFF